MSITKKAGAAALVASMAVGVPSAAVAKGGGDRDGAVPSRIAAKLKSANRALERAQDRADDGETVAAAASLTAVRKHLASAGKSASKRIAAASSTGAPSASAVSRTDHKVVGGTAALLDGAGDVVVEAAATTLDAALDNRDALIAAIAGLDADDKADYEGALDRIADQVDGELEDLGEAYTDDELTDAAKTALTNAATQLNATAAAVEAQQTVIAGEDAESDEEEADYPGGSDAPPAGRPSAQDCPKPGAGRPQGQQQNRPQGQQNQDTPAGDYPS